MTYTPENSVRYREERAAYERSLLPPPVDPEVARREKLARNAALHIEQAQQRQQRERAITRGKLLIDGVLVVASPAERQAVIQKVAADQSLTEDQRLALDGTAAAYSDALEEIRASGTVPRYYPSRNARGEFKKR
jgi:hypothetical protein